MTWSCLGSDVEQDVGLRSEHGGEVRGRDGLVVVVHPLSVSAFRARRQRTESSRRVKLV